MTVTQKRCLIGKPVSGKIFTVLAGHIGLRFLLADGADWITNAQRVQLAPIISAIPPLTTNHQ